jgi:(p)ppGpp synthase/HD superfamily hydrolase
MRTMIFEAIQFAAEVHAGHYRKGSNVPYIYHLTNVMKILCDAGCKEEVIVAGLLHDAVEDTAATLEMIEARFGLRVAQLVAMATEPEKLNKDAQEAPWKARKAGTLKALATAEDAEKIILSCADKLDNIRAIQEDYNKIGEAFWTRFNAGKEEQCWYYQNLALIFEERGKQFGAPLATLAQTFGQTVSQVFGDLQ